MTEAAPDVRPVDANRTALVLMDFHARYLDRTGDPATLLARAADALRQARDAGVQVAFVRVALTPQDFASIPSRNKTYSDIAATGRMAEGTDETRLHPAVVPADGDIVVTKTRTGAFSTTNLDTHLRGRGIDTLILAGVSTSGVILSTLRTAADLDYRLLVLADCCGDPDAEVHRVMLEKVFPRQADVIETARLASLLR